MARRKKAQPKSPEQIMAERIAARARDMEAVNLPAETAILSQQDNIEVTRAGEKRGDQKADHDVARRVDAFTALKDGMAPGAFTAVRRYEEKLMIRRREADRAAPCGRVDKTAGLVTDGMLDAATWLEAADARLMPHDLWLLRELIAPTKEWINWRSCVGRITGEENPHSQATVVRMLALSVMGAVIHADQHMMDRRGRVAA